MKINSIFKRTQISKKQKLQRALSDIGILENYIEPSDSFSKESQAKNDQDFYDLITKIEKL